MWHKRKDNVVFLTHKMCQNASINEDVNNLVQFSEPQSGLVAISNSERAGGSVTAAFVE